MEGDPAQVDDVIAFYRDSGKAISATAYVGVTHLPTTMYDGGEIRPEEGAK